MIQAVTTNSDHSGVWMPQWSLGDRLRRIRRDLNLSQDEMAKRIGVQKGRYSAWESDRNRPDDLVVTAKRIQVLSGVPAAWVLGVEDPQGPGGPDGDGRDSRRSAVREATGR